MRRLLRPDFESFVNSMKRRGGRSEFVGSLVFFGCVVLGSIVVARKIVLSDALLEALGENATAEASPLLEILLATLLVGPLFFALPLAGALVGRLLFSEPSLALVVTSPIPRIAILGRAFVQASATLGLLHIAFGVPMVLAISREVGLPAMSAAVYPVAALALDLPLVAAVLAAWVTRERFLTGRFVQVSVQIIGVVGVLGMTVLALGGLLSSNEQQRWIVDNLQQFSTVPEPLGSAVDLLLSPASGFSLIGAMWIVALVSVSLPLVLGAAPLFDRAYENSFLGQAPAVRIRRRFWPAGPAASIAYKDALLIVQERSGLVAYLFFGCLQLIFLKSGLYFGIREGSPLPDPLQEAFALLMCWLVLLIMIGPLHTTGLAETEKKQLPLIATSPIARGSLLRGKVLLLALPFAWTFTCLVLASPWIAGTSGAGVACFVGFGLPIGACVVAVVAVVATHPVLFEIEGALSHSVRAIAPLTVVMAVIGGLIVGVVKMFGLFEETYRGNGFLAVLGEPGSVASGYIVAWLLGGLLSFVGYRLSQRHLTRLLLPRD